MTGRLRLFIPLLLFVLLAVLLYAALGLDPHAKPSALLGRPMPEFKLPTLAQPEIAVDQTVIAPQVSLLNVWASWCVSCRVEHPQLQRISADFGIPIYGVNYKDQLTDARQWLQRFGNPYRSSFLDQSGKLGLDLGVAGAPETFVLDAKRVIRYKHVGVIDARNWHEQLLPVIRQLQAENAQVSR